MSDRIVDAIIQKPLFETPSVAHTRSADASTLIMRVMTQSEVDANVLLDLTGDISRVASSFQACDLLLLERVIQQERNPQRYRENKPPIKLNYIIPEGDRLNRSLGMIDLACLGFHKLSTCMTEKQKKAFEKLASKQQNDLSIEYSDDEDAYESSEVTLLPIFSVNTDQDSVISTETVQKKLAKLLEQGLPGINKAYIQGIVTFIQESTANIRDHAGREQFNCEGFVAANRTRRGFRDRDSGQLVEVYTTYVVCYDLGQGVLSALTSVDEYAAELANCPEVDRGILALKMAARPGISSAKEEGRGGGLSNMVNMVRNIIACSDDKACRYSAVINIMSSGANLKFLSLSEDADDYPQLPGTQLQLLLQAVRRRDE